MATPVDLATANALQCVHISLQNYSTTGPLLQGYLTRTRQNCCLHIKWILWTSIWKCCRLCIWHRCTGHTGHRALNQLGWKNISSCLFTLYFSFFPIYCLISATVLGRLKKCGCATGATELLCCRTKEQERKTSKKCQTTLQSGFQLWSDQEKTPTSSPARLLNIQITNSQYAAWKAQA